MRLVLALMIFVLAMPVVGRSADEVSLGDVADRALEQSKLTLPGGKPFHMKVEIVETTRPNSEYQAKIEEYCVSPGKWKRTIQSPKEGCDSTGLQNPLRDAVKQLLGFTFHTNMSGNPLPDLTDAEVRKLAKGVSEPAFPPGTERGAEYVVRISVDENGKVTGVDNPNRLPGPIFMAIYRAVSTWKFKPYVKDGKSQYFQGNVAFRKR